MAVDTENTQQSTERVAEDVAAVEAAATQGQRHDNGVSGNDDDCGGGGDGGGFPPNICETYYFCKNNSTDIWACFLFLLNI